METLLKNAQVVASIEDKNMRDILERVYLIKQSLLSSDIQQRIVKVGHRQIISRLRIFFQENAASVLLEKDVANGWYKVLHHTVLDPVWKDDFETTLKKPEKLHKLPSKNKNPNYIYLDLEECQNYVFPIHKNIFLLCFLADFKKSKGYEPPEFKAIKFKNGESSDNHSFEELVKEVERDSAFKYFYANKINVMTEPFCKEGANWWHKQSIKIDDPDIKFTPQEKLYLKTYKKNKAAEDCRDEIQYFFDEHYKKAVHVFEFIYESFKGSPLLCKNGKAPPNIMFGIMMFDRETKRYRGSLNGKLANSDGAYSHGVRHIVPDSQRKDIKEALKGKLSPKEIDEMLDNAERPFGDKARSVFDAAFCGGYVQFLNEPIKYNIFNRLDEPEGPPEKIYKNDPDYKRLLDYTNCAEIFFSQPDKTAKYKQIIVPIHIAGAPVYAMGHIVKCDTNDPQKTWREIYHFYHSVANYAIRSIRTRVNNLYIKEIQDTYYNVLHAIVYEIANSKNNLEYTPEEVANRLNTPLKLLSRVYPFQYVKFTWNPNAKTSKDQISFKVLDDTWNYKVGIYDNPYFKLNTPGIFLKIDQIEIALQQADATLARVLMTSPNES
ncbi:MAG: hypothetical protein V4629_02365 [Pseudomonadota bacterium]